MKTDTNGNGGNGSATEIGSKLTAALGEAARAADPKAASSTIEVAHTAPALLDSEAPANALVLGSGNIEGLFTRVIFTPVGGDVYARERERRGKAAITIGYSRKVADVQIELAGTGIYTPATISIVQGITEKAAHLEMSIGVWNPDTRKSSILCSDAATKERLQDWKTKTCGEFKTFCDDHGIDLNAPAAAKEHANAVGVNLLTSAPAAS